jgi:transcriptional regulator with GAF, ATPase, and Fis domain
MVPHKDDAKAPAPLGQDDSLDDLAEAEELLRDLAPGGGEGATATSDPEVDDLQNLARARSAERSLAAFRRAALAISVELDLRTLVKRIIAVMVETLGVERGVVFLGQDSQAGLVPGMVLGIEGQELDDVERVSLTILAMARQGETVVTADAASDARLRAVPSVQLKRIRSVLCAPLVVGRDTVGVLYLDSPNARKAFSAEAERFFKAFADVAAVAIQNAQMHGDLVQTNQRLRSLSGANDGIGLLFGLSPALAGVRRKAILAAQLACPVLILGEVGTETEIFASAVASVRRDIQGGFFSYHCASDPLGLAENILFGGPVRPGPRSRRRAAGLVGMAAGGVLFLDEITSLDIKLQARLLPFLGDGAVASPMTAGSIPGNVQLIAATSRDIHAEVESGRCDRELHRRLGAFRVQIPPLRDRPDDVPLLAARFARKYAWLRGSGSPVSFTAEALATLQTWPWPGNIDELEGLVQRLSARVGRSRVDVLTLRRVATAPAGREAAGLSSDKLAGPEAGSRTMAEIQCEAIRHALIFTKWNKAWAARLLGMQRNTFLRKIRKYGISFPEVSEDEGSER